MAPNIPQQSIGRQAFSGIAWMSLSVFLVKILALALQLILGRLLSPSDYSVFAGVSVAITLASGFQNSGVSKLLIQSADDYTARIKKCTDYAFLMGMTGLLFTTLIGLGLSRFYHNNILFYAVALSAISIPFTALVNVQFARLSIDLQFSFMCKTDVIVAIGNILAVTTVAYCGYGSFSIGAGLVLSNILRYYLYFNKAKTLFPDFSISRKDALHVFANTKWIMLGVLLTGLAQQGDYLVLGKLLSPTMLGYYYFGFQLTANVGQLLAQGIGSTFLPIFSNIRNDHEKLKKSFLLSSKVLTLICSVLSLGVIGLIPQLVHTLWNGKWDNAILTATLIALSLPIKMLSTISASTLDSLGVWRLRTVLLIIDATTLTMAAIFGGLVGNLIGAICAVTIQRTITGLIDYYVACRKLRLLDYNYLSFTLRSFLPYFLGVSIFFKSFLDQAKQDYLPQEWMPSAYNTAISLILYVLVYSIANLDVVKYSANFIQLRISRFNFR